KNFTYEVQLCTQLAKSGIPVVSCNYFLSSFGPCVALSDPCGGGQGLADPATTIGDVKKVVAWMRGDGQAQFELPHELVVAGTSAGAHLAAMLATTEAEPYFNADPMVDYSVDM